MNILGFPVRFNRPDPTDPDSQFWYWRGASGRKYIHSVYAPDDCPPLPGAVYIAVAREGGNRRVLAVGSFASVLDKPQMVADRMDMLKLGANEIHVHLLAKSHDDAAAVERDLSAGLLVPQAANAA
jgi:hypothetical protein